MGNSHRPWGIRVAAQKLERADPRCCGSALSFLNSFRVAPGIFRECRLFDDLRGGRRAGLNGFRCHAFFPGAVFERAGVGAAGLSRRIEIAPISHSVGGAGTRDESGENEEGGSGIHAADRSTTRRRCQSWQIIQSAPVSGSCSVPDCGAAKKAIALACAAATLLALCP